MAQSATTNNLATLPQARRPRTERRDAWWLENWPFVIVLSLFAIYTTWRALAGDYYWSDPYLSPFYSPLIDPQHHFVPRIISPAILILWGPLGFRMTCYYYRKGYYRGFFADPPACAVGEKKTSGYCGETAFPYILQNVHRYFFVIALVFLAFLWYDAIRAFFFPNGVGVGVGTVVMLVNIILLTGYTFGCHSFRHLSGGRLDCFSCSAAAVTRHKAWRGVTRLNEHHMFWAWVSMISVGLTDLYIRLVAAGTIKDIRLL